MKHVYLDDEPIPHGPKFIVLSARDKRSRVSGYENRTDKEEGWVIVKTDGCGNVEDIVAEDFGEIEDRIFARDLYHVAEAFEAMQVEIDRLRSLLSSGQCVDLSKLTDDELGEVAGARHRSSGLRARLIEQAGVKL